MMYSNNSKAAAIDPGRRVSMGSPIRATTFYPGRMVSTGPNDKASSYAHGPPKEKPKRPLSAYNIFFKTERGKILEATPTRKEGKPRRSHGKIGFAELARSIAAKWNKIDAQTRAHYDGLAAKDKQRYVREMKEWKERQELESDLALSPGGFAFGLSKGAVIPQHPSLQSLVNQYPTFLPQNNHCQGERYSAARSFDSSTPYSVADALEMEALEATKSVQWEDDIFPDILPESSRNFGKEAPSHEIAELATKMEDECVDWFLDIFRE